MIFKFDTPDDMFYGNEDSFDALMRGERWIPCSMELQGRDLVFPAIVRADTIFAVSPITPNSDPADEVFDEKRFLALTSQYTTRVKNFQNNIRGES